MELQKFPHKRSSDIVEINDVEAFFNKQIKAKLTCTAARRRAGGETRSPQCCNAVSEWCACNSAHVVVLCVSFSESGAIALPCFALPVLPCFAVLCLRVIHLLYTARCRVIMRVCVHACLCEHVLHVRVCVRFLYTYFSIYLGLKYVFFG